MKGVDIFVEDVQKALSQLQDTEKLLSYLSGDYTPKLKGRYILHMKKSMPRLETVISASPFSGLPRNIYVSEETPIVLYSRTSEHGKTYKLIPAQGQCLIFNPGGTYKFKIVGETDCGEIVITTNKDFHITGARFNLQALQYFTEYLPYGLYGTLAITAKGAIKKKLAGIDVTFDDLLDELSRTLAKSFLSFCHLAGIWPKAILVEDTSMLRVGVEAQTKARVLERINENFQKLLKTVKRVKMLENRACVPA